jgi:hypothetical protein
MRQKHARQSDHYRFARRSPEQVPPVRYRSAPITAKSYLVRRRIAQRSHAAAHDQSISHGDGRAQITPIGRGPDDPAHDQTNAPNGGYLAV